MNFILSDPSGVQPDDTVFGLRSAPPDAHSDVYTFTAARPFGNYVLTGVFHSGTAQSSQAIGIASLPVILSSAGLTKTDGSQIGTISFSAMIHKVSVLPSQFVIAGQSAQIIATCFDAFTNVVVVTPGSFTWRLYGGASFLSLTPDGIGNGLGPGTATVVASVDGINSNTQTVLVKQFQSQPTFSIDWPDRSRDVKAGQAALSFQAVMHDTSGATADTSYNGDRTGGSAAYVQAITFANPRPIGVYTLSGTFYSGAGETGSTVETFVASVKLQKDGSLTKPDGSPLGTVSFTTLIKSVTVTAAQTVDLYGHTQLVATAADSGGNPVAVTPGSINWTLYSGSGNMTLTKDGIGAGTNLGTATVSASIDGVPSPGTTVTVVRPVESILPVSCFDIAYDAVNKKIWGVTANASTTYPTMLVGIDPLTGLVGPTLTLPVEPREVAVTDDGQFAYVWSTDDVVRRVTLATMTITQSVTASYGFGLCTIPGSPHSFAASDDPVGGVNTRVWDDTTVRSGLVAGGYFIKAASKTRLYGLGGNQLYRSTMTPTTITWNDQHIGLVDSNFALNGGLMYSGSGQIVDPEAITTIGHFAVTDFLSNHVIDLDVPDNRAYFVTWSGDDKKLLSFDLTSLGEQTVRDAGNVVGNCPKVVACDNHTAAFIVSGGPPAVLVIMRQLP